MRVGFIGKGNVASGLGPLLSARGHRVTYGVRGSLQGREIRELIALTGPDSRGVSLRELASEADVIILSARWEQIAVVIEELGDVAGKILVDCVTPMARGKKELLFGFTTSAAEEIARMAPSARVVKAFDTCGVQAMKRPDFAGVRATMYFCGDDLPAKRIVSDLVRDIGMEPCDAGGLRIARYLEPMAMLWVHLALVQNYGDDIAFKLLTRKT